ncbi:hypothetical protein D3C71_1623660 [compost metagenome]
MYRGLDADLRVVLGHRGDLDADRLHLGAHGDVHDFEGVWKLDAQAGFQDAHELRAEPRRGLERLFGYDDEYRKEPEAEDAVADEFQDEEQGGDEWIVQIAFPCWSEIQELDGLALLMPCQPIFVIEDSGQPWDDLQTPQQQPGPP